jgi:hypothetical protein
LAHRIKCGGFRIRITMPVNGEQKIVWKEAAYQLPPGSNKTTNETSARMAMSRPGFPKLKAVTT